MTDTPPSDSQASTELARQLAVGRRHHAEGRLDLAAACYDAVLAREPDHPDALHLAGYLSLQQGETRRAIHRLQAAVAARPGDPARRASLAAALSAAGRRLDAARALQSSLAIMPGQALDWLNLGRLLLAGEAASCVSILWRAVVADPRRAEGWERLAVASRRAGDHDRARAALAQALALAPGLPAVHFQLANLAADSEDREAAERHLRRALCLAPGSADALRNHAALVRLLDRIAEADRRYGRAIAADPGFAAPWSGRSAARHDIDLLTAAVADGRRAAVLEPGFSEAYNNLAQIAFRYHDPQATLRLVDRAVLLEPGHPAIRFNRATYLLAFGRLEEGWHEHEYRRLKAPFIRRLGLPAEEWSGGDLAGRRLLVCTEQGLGDEILFASCLGDVTAKVEACVVDCDPRLIPLFARSFARTTAVPRAFRPAGPDIVVDYGPLVAAQRLDCHIPMGTLPMWLRPTLESFPRHAGYLAVDDDERERWRRRLEALGPGPKVGLCWRSGITSVARRSFYGALTDWAPVLTLPGIVLVNLQYDRPDAELATARERFGVSVAGWDDIDLRNDIDRIAALIAALDAVATAETAVNSIAGAVGTPTVCCTGQRGWPNLGTDGTPWFPSVRYIFRHGDEPWTETTGRAAAALVEALASKKRPSRRPPS